VRPQLGGPPLPFGRATSYILDLSLNLEDVLMTRRSVLLVAVLMFAVACKKDGGGSAATSKYPGTEEGAKQLLTDLRADGTLIKSLRPSSDDYKAVFIGDAAGKAETGNEKLWAESKSFQVDPAKTELLLYKATTEDLQKWTPEVEANFPGGYKRVADKYKPGLTVYRWKFVTPGEKIGMSGDGLINVNGHWALFPKPWRTLGGSGGGE
jgi:hypothetical protein